MSDKGFTITNEIFNEVKEFLDKFTEKHDCDYDNVIDAIEEVGDVTNGR